VGRSDRFFAFAGVPMDPPGPATLKWIAIYRADPPSSPRNDVNRWKNIATS